MPKATVDEQRKFVLRENNIWLTKKILRMKAKSQANSVSGFTNSDFGRRIFPPDPRH